MSQVNLNSAQPTLPQVMPPVPTGMSTVARVVVALAVVFFATFLYIAFSKPSKPHCPPPTSPRAQLTKEDQEELTRKIHRLKEGMQAFQEVATGEKMQIFDLNSEQTMDQGLLTKLEDFVAQLRDKYNSVCLDGEIKGLSDPALSRLRAANQKGVDDAYDESLMQDQAKELQKKTEAEMKIKLESLNGKIERETANLEERQESLECLRRCWGNIVNLVRYNNIGKESFADQLLKFKKRFNIPSGLDKTIPKDLFGDRIEAFNAKYSDETFQTQRTELGKQYERYTTAISTINDRLAWVRLKDLYNSLGEDNFRTALNTSNLYKIFEGKEIDIS